MKIEQAKADLQEALSGPAGMNWGYGPAVNAVLKALSFFENQNAALAAENISLKECQSDVMKHVYRSKTYLENSRVVDAIQGLQCAIERKAGSTPATDAYQDQLRANGVDAAMGEFKNNEGKS